MSEMAGRRLLARGITCNSVAFASIIAWQCIRNFHRQVVEQPGQTAFLAHAVGDDHTTKAPR